MTIAAAIDLQFQSLADALPILIWRADPHNHATWFNRHWLEFTGQSLEESLGEGWTHAVHPEDAATVAATCQQHQDRRESFEMEFRLRRRDGEYRWVVDRAGPTFDPLTGEFLGYIGSCIDITDRKLEQERTRYREMRLREAVEELARSEARYHYAFDAAGVSLWEQDFTAVAALIEQIKASGVSDIRAYLDEHPEVVARAAGLIEVRDVNRETLRMFGARAPEELAGSLGRIFTESAWPVFKEELMALAEGRRSVAAEVELRTLSGEALCCLFSIMFPAAPAALDRVLVTLVDVTDRKRIEIAKLEESRRLSTAAKVARLGIWEYDVATGVTTLDERASDIFGVARQTITGEGIHELIHPQDRERVQEQERRALDQAGAGVYACEYRIQRPDGSLRWVVVRGEVVPDAQGRFVRFLGSIMDVSEQRLVQERAQQLASVLEGTTDLVAISDARGRLTYINRAGRQMLGAPLDADISNYEQSRFCPAWVLERTRREWMPAAARDGAVSDEAAVLTMDGREIPISFVLIVQRGSDGHVQAYATIARDITTQRRARQALLDQQRKLEEADRQKDNFLSMLGHELRNPLASIRNGGEILSRTSLADPYARQATGVIVRQAAHLARLVDDLLDVARITRGRIELKRAEVDLAQIVLQAIETVEPLMREKGHTLSVASSAHLLRVHGDHVRLVQCIANLLTNAAKYTDPGGAIQVHTRVEQSSAVIEIADNGSGIAPELLPRVFDLFVQADRTLDRAQGGLGIGLSLVKALIEMHGGTVSARSEGLGRGAAFAIRLPLSCSEPQRVASAARTPHASQSILIVDDNADAANSLATLLMLEGHEVETAYDATQALERVRSFIPDVALLDIGLPRLDGYALVRRLRATPGLERTRYIALSGYGQAEDQQRSRAAGFDLHFTKPVDLSVLRGAISDGANRTHTGLGQ